MHGRGRWRTIAAYILLLSSLGSLALFLLLGSEQSQVTSLLPLRLPWTQPENAQNPQLHLIIPATSSNKDLCKLLLSAAVLDYPEPVLVNWGAEEDENSYIQHLAKVNKVLEYLNSLPSATAEDLVLIVDGYDVWLQLPPEVLISRYHVVMEAANRRLQSRFDPAVLRANDIRQTVLFGPDKLCWPNGDTGERPACWAASESTLPKHAFGRFAEQTSGAMHQRPRWLNSGTIIGPLAEVQAVFEGTAREIQRNHTTDSDQFYFANLFGAQEYARRHLQKTPLPDPEGSTAPFLEAGHKTEYHIGIDYEYAVFQNLGYSLRDVAWMLYGTSRKTGSFGHNHVLKPYRYELPSDIFSAPSPFLLVSELGSGTEILHSSTDEVMSFSDSWEDMPLASNVITKQIPVLLHFTLDKELRDQWWDRMWFYPYGERLLRASFNRSRTPLGGSTVVNLSGGLEANVDGTMTEGGKRDGAWSDKGDWIPWEALCRVYEPQLFGSQ